MSSKGAVGGRIPVAVLGTGSIGTRHLELLRKIEGVEPVAVPMRRDRRRYWERSGYRVASGWEQMVGDGPLLGVVATDTARHAEDACQALNLGFNLLVEKPLAVNIGEAARIKACAARAGRRVFVGCVLRFSDSLNVFRQQLPRIGRVHTVHIECQSYLPDWRPDRAYKDAYSAREGEGGVLRDLIHEIDYAGWLFGWPEAIQARIRNTGRLGISADEIAWLSWEASSGTLVSISLDYLTRPSRRGVRASGEKGTLEWDGIGLSVALKRPGKRDELATSQQTKEALYTAQLQSFIQACVEDAPSRLATLQEGYRAVSISDAARRASDSRRETKVDYRVEDHS